MKPHESKGIQNIYKPIIRLQWFYTPRANSKIHKSRYWVYTCGANIWNWVIDGKLGRSIIQFCSKCPWFAITGKVTFISPITMRRVQPRWQRCSVNPISIFSIKMDITGNGIDALPAMHFVINHHQLGFTPLPYIHWNEKFTKRQAIKYLVNQITLLQYLFSRMVNVMCASTWKLCPDCISYIISWSGNVYYVFWEHVSFYPRWLSVMMASHYLYLVQITVNYLRNVIGISDYLLFTYISLTISTI